MQYVRTEGWLVTPQARLEGNDQQMLAERRRKLATARLTGDIAHHQAPTDWACECAGSGQPESAQVALVLVAA